MGHVLSGCFVRRQQPVKISCLSSGTPRSTRERERECVCINVLSFVWVMCCLDVSSVVSSLSRCLVFRQAPRVKREREKERESVCVLMC